MNNTNQSWIGICVIIVIFTIVGIMNMPEAKENPVTADYQLEDRPDLQITKNKTDEEIICEKIDKIILRLGEWHRWIKLYKEGKLTLEEVKLLLKGSNTLEEMDDLISEAIEVIKKLREKIRELQILYLDELSKDL